MSCELLVAFRAELGDPFNGLRFRPRQCNVLPDTSTFEPENRIRRAFRISGCQEHLEPGSPSHTPKMPEFRLGKLCNPKPTPAQPRKSSMKSLPSCNSCNIGVGTTCQLFHDHLRIAGCIGATHIQISVLLVLTPRRNSYRRNPVPSSRAPIVSRLCCLFLPCRPGRGFFGSGLRVEVPKGFQKGDRKALRTITVTTLSPTRLLQEVSVGRRGPRVGIQVLGRFSRSQDPWLQLLFAVSGWRV